MRLDLVLKLSGIIKRRTVAKEVVDRGHVLVNDKTGKPSTDIKEGDRISLLLPQRTIEVIISFEQKGKMLIPVCSQIDKGLNNNA